MNLLRHTILTTAIALLSLGTQAQWGVHAGFGMERYSSRLDGHWTVGMEHDMSGRTSIGLSVIGLLPVLAPVSRTANNSTYSYTYMRKGIGVQYRSIFFLTDDAAGVYVGATVGMRSLQRVALVDTINYTSSAIWPGGRTAKATVFPVGLRLGVRGMLDGWYSDFYVAVCTQLGRNSDDMPTLYPFNAPEDRLKGLTIQVGYALGLAW
jgi:hypothetical protein